jgi:hypothetical protein
LPEASPQVFIFDINESLRTLTTMSIRDIFCHVKVGVLQQASSDNKPVSGQLTIYEPLEAPVGIWELASEDGMVSRGDVRELLEILPFGSKVFLRRKARTPPNSSVQSTPLKFESITEAQDFIGKAKFCKEQYQNSSEPIYIETTRHIGAAKGLLPVEDAMKQGPATESADEAELKPNVPSTPASKLEQPTFEKSLLEKPDSEELKLEQPVAELGQSNEETEPNIRPTTSPTMEVESPPANVAVLEAHWTPSGWIGDDLIDLSSDPGSALGEECNELTGVNYEPSGAVECCIPRADAKSDTPTEQTSQSIEDAGGPRGLQIDQQPVPVEPDSDFNAPNVGQREGEGKAHTKAVEEVLHTLQEPNVIQDIRVGKDLSQESLRLLSKITSADYAEMTMVSDHIARVLKPYETPYSEKKLTAFQASLLHLVRKSGFMDLSLDDQKKTVAVVHSNVLHGKESRITRSPSEISALRLEGRGCPQAVKNFNTEIRDWKRKHPGQTSISSQPNRVPSHQPPVYSRSTVTNQVGSSMKFLYSHDAIDETTVPGQQAPLDSITNIPRSMSKEVTLSESSKASEKAPKGLEASRWAPRRHEDAEKQSVTRHENIQPHNASSF